MDALVAFIGGLGLVIAPFFALQMITSFDSESAGHNLVYLYWGLLAISIVAALMLAFANLLFAVLGVIVAIGGLKLSDSFKKPAQPDFVVSEDTSSDQ